MAVVALGFVLRLAFRAPGTPTAVETAIMLCSLISAVMIVAATFWWNAHTRRRIGRHAALSERQRIARDLHDGLAQDLAFIAAHAARLAPADGVEHPVAIAARRALNVTRGAIVELSDLSDVPVADALAALAHELATRFDMSIAVSVSPGIPMAPDATRDLLRIVREAIVNAARHGGARNVSVTLECATAGAILRVSDDGRGIADAHGVRAPEGFGLRSIRERAESLGARMSIEGPERGGTELLVALP